MDLRIFIVSTHLRVSRRPIWFPESGDRVDFTWEQGVKCPGLSFRPSPYTALFGY